MELDELKQLWDGAGPETGRQHPANRSPCPRVGPRQGRTGLEAFVARLIVGLVINLAAAGWVGSFLAEHVADSRYFIPALALQVGLVALIIVSVRQLAAIAQIDYAAPIVEIQRRLESLRIERIHATKWTLLLSPLAWVPLFIVAMKGFFDVDVYSDFGVGWVAANVVFGLLFIPAGVWVCRRFGGQVENSNLRPPADAGHRRVQFGGRDRVPPIAVAIRGGSRSGGMRQVRT